MVLDTSWEGIASAVVAVGLVSAYFLKGNFSNNTSPEANSTSQPAPQQSDSKDKKKKKGKKPPPPSEPVEYQNVPGGISLSPTAPDVAAEDSALIAASLDAGNVAQETRKKTKKAAKRAKEPTTKQPQAPEQPTVVDTPAAAPKRKPVAKKDTLANLPVAQPEEEGEWRKVERGRKGTGASNITDSQASLTTASATDPGSPTDPNFPTLEESRSDGLNTTKTLAEKLTPKVRKTAVDE